MLLVAGFLKMENAGMGCCWFLDFSKWKMQAFSGFESMTGSINRESNGS